MTIKTPWNPSQKATKRVKDPSPVPKSCCHCSGNIKIVNNSEIYSKEYGEWPWAYLCESCGAYVGMHPFTNIPLGTLATKQIREARKSCKPYFTRMFNAKKIHRSEGYKLLAAELGIDTTLCHFGLFDVDMCQKAKSACLKLMGS
ncbi:zinc-finger-containing protein [Providencia rettgeri]|nr:hypothetical protein [Providencia rettgeri]